jgi:hypothetical protein
MTIRVHFDGKVLVPEEPVDLPTDRPLDIDVKEANDLRLGSPALLLRIMHEPPHVPKELVDEMERAIKEAEVPARDEGCFDDLKEMTGA